MEKSQYIIVGLGNHAKKVLVPSIIESNAIIVGIVSRSCNKVKGFNCFESINTAIKKFPKANIVISNPPEVHYKTLVSLKNFKNIVFIEKPIFTDFNQVVSYKNDKSLFDLNIIEMMMYKRTNLYKIVLKKLQKNLNEKKIDYLRIVFLIPELPKNTFRDKSNLESSIIYDIGCYAFSFLFDLNLKFEIQNINFNFMNENNLLKKIVMTLKVFMPYEFDIEIIFGQAENYENYIEYSSGRVVRNFSPFFNGKQLKKKVHTEIRNGNKLLCFTREIQDQNGFTTIFKYPNGIDREIQLEEYFFVNSYLELIKIYIKMNCNYEY